MVQWAHRRQYGFQTAARYRDEEMKYVFIIANVWSFWYEDKKMNKYQYSQDTDQLFLLVKGLVDNRQKVDFPEASFD